MRPNTSLEKEFLDCLDYVQLFIEKLNLLCDYDYEKLKKIFNPYLSVARKGSMKDFYVMFLIFEYFDNHIIKTYKLEILNDLGSIFKLMKNMPTRTDASFFMENIKSFIEKYQK